MKFIVEEVIQHVVEISEEVFNNITIENWGHLLPENYNQNDIVELALSHGDPGDYVAARLHSEDSRVIRLMQKSMFRQDCLNDGNVMIQTLD